MEITVSVDGVKVVLRKVKSKMHLPFSNKHVSCLIFPLKECRNFGEVLGGGEGGEEMSVVITSNSFLSRQSVVGEIMTK